MKKSYVNPSLKEMDIDNENLLQGVSNKKGDGVQLSKEGFFVDDDTDDNDINKDQIKFKSVWEEE